MKLIRPTGFGRRAKKPRTLSAAVRWSLIPTNSGVASLRPTHSAAPNRGAASPNDGDPSHSQTATPTDGEDPNHSQAAANNDKARTPSAPSRPPALLEPPGSDRRRAERTPAA